MVFFAVVLLVVLVIGLRRSGWPGKGKALAGVLFFLGVVVVGMNEFFAESKLISFIPAWLCYLTDAFVVTGMGVLTGCALRDACK